MEAAISERPRGQAMTVRCSGSTRALPRAVASRPGHRKKRAAGNTA